MFQPANRAHLGTANKFTYDEGLGQWVLQDEDSADSAKRSSRRAGGRRGAARDEMEEDELEQHAITLAIQAAHLASQWHKHGGGNQGPPAGVLFGSNRTGVDRRRSTPNCRLLFLLLSLHSVWCIIHLGLETVVPLWMFSPASRGGLGFEPVDAALVLGFVGSILLILKSFVPRKLSSLSQHAPLRGLRVGIGLQLVLALAASWVPTLGFPQNESLAVWVLVTVLVTGLAASVILARSGTTVMLQVALESQLREDVKRYLQWVVALSEIVGPILSSWCFAWAYEQGTPYPMDATFFFNVCAFLSLGLYTASLVLHVHVVGDFGAAPEGAFDGGSSQLCGIEKRCPGASALICLEEIFIVPATDVNALIGDATADESREDPGKDM